MSEKKSADESIGIFLGDRSPIAVPLKPLHVGPGAPGPGDEWHVSMAPPETEDAVDLEPVHSDGTVVLPRHPTDKG